MQLGKGSCSSEKHIQQRLLEVNNVKCRDVDQEMCKGAAPQETDATLGVKHRQPLQTLSTVFTSSTLAKRLFLCLPVHDLVWESNENELHLKFPVFLRVPAIPFPLTGGFLDKF